MAGLLPFMRETPGDEWSFYLKSPLCKELDVSDSPQPGDIGSIESRTPIGSRPIHGFVHVAENLVYSKMGIEVKDPYRLMSLEDQSKSYPIGVLKGECGSDCQMPPTLEWYISPDEMRATGLTELELNPQICDSEMLVALSKTKRSLVEKACADAKQRLEGNKEACERECAPSSLQYYRFSSFEEYYKNNEDRVYFDEVKDRIESIECQLESQAMTGNPLSSSAKKNIEDTFIALAAYLDHQKETEVAKDEFIRGALMLRLEGITAQLRGSRSNTGLADLIESWRTKNQ